MVTGRKEERKESELPWDEDGSVLGGGAGEEEEKETSWDCNWAKLRTSLDML